MRLVETLDYAHILEILDEVTDIYALEKVEA